MIEFPEDWSSSNRALATPQDVELRRERAKMLGEIERLKDVISDLKEDLTCEQTVSDGLRSMCRKLIDELKMIRLRVDDLLHIRENDQ